MSEQAAVTARMPFIRSGHTEVGDGTCGLCDVVWPCDAGTVLMALAASEAARVAAERQIDMLKRRVWTLRPTLKSALRVMEAIYPQYEGHHEGGEIAGVIERSEQALKDTAGPSDAPSAPSADQRASAAEAQVAALTAALDDLTHPVLSMGANDMVMVNAAAFKHARAALLAAQQPAEPRPPHQRGCTEPGGHGGWCSAEPDAAEEVRG